MKSDVRVFAPATVANVGCAFDIIGFPVSAPGDEVIARTVTGSGVRITKIHGDSGKLPTEPDKNTAGVAVQSFLKHIQSDAGVELEIFKQMPLGSGLGSSAASAVGAVVAVNELLGAPCTRRELLPFVIAAEKAACGVAHADNVAPSLLGGFILVRSYDPLEVHTLPTPAELCCTVVHPEIEIRTEDARKILRKDVQLATAVKQWGNIAGLVTGLFTEDYDLIGRSLTDHIVEPVRSLLIPGFHDAQTAALESGALGCSLSGSGPSMFALSRGEATAQSTGRAMQQAFAELSIDSQAYVSLVNANGPIIR
jgi:homoserine kinase